MQHYPNPMDVLIPDGTRASQRLTKVIKREGLIVPILVSKTYEGKFRAGDDFQAEKVLVCRRLGWDSILVEDNWTRDDLNA